MLHSNASRAVLALVLAIAAFELGITGKVGQVWSLAFRGAPGATTGPAKPPSSSTPSSPTIPPVVIA